MSAPGRLAPVDVRAGADAARADETTRRRRPPRPVPPLALRVEEAADCLGVSLDFFREHVLPELRIVRRGRVRLVAVAELEAWLARSGERLTGAER